MKEFEEKIKALEERVKDLENKNYYIPSDPVHMQKDEFGSWYSP